MSANANSTNPELNINVGEKVKSRLHQKPKSLVRSTSVVSGMTMLSRGLGFVRDLMIAQLFGAVAGMDAFYVAFKIPNFMRRLFAEGSFSQAFVPVLAEHQTQLGDEATKDFIARIAGTLGFVLLLVTIAAELATPLLVRVFALGYEVGSYKFLLATDLLRITFPYLLFISLTAMTGAVLNTYHRFAIPAFTPVFLNICMIAAAVWVAPHFHPEVEALAWGVFIAGVVQFVFQLPFMWRLGLLSWPRIAFRSPDIRRVMTLMLPSLFGVSVSQINLLLDTVFASYLPTGSMTWLYNSDRLMGFPLGVFGVAVATVILPALSRQHAKKNHDAYGETLDWALQMMLFISMPAAVVLLIIPGQMLATLMGYGAYTKYDVLMTAQSLGAFALGVPAFMLVKILAAGFYGKQNIKTPVKIGFIAMLTNTALNLMLIGTLKHQGIALSTTIAAWVNTLLLLVYLYKQGIYRLGSSWKRFMLQHTVANLGLTAWLWFMTKSTLIWLDMSWHQRVFNFTWISVGAVTIYLVLLYSLGFRFNHFRNAREHD